LYHLYEVVNLLVMEFDYFLLILLSGGYFCCVIVVLFIYHCCIINRLSCLRSYVLIHFDSPPTLPVSLSEHFHLDTDIVRPRVLRMEEEVSRPCRHRPCDFGEMTEEMRSRLHKDLAQFVRKL